jgi:Flp pilus assembly pilin Flp
VKWARSFSLTLSARLTSRNEGQTTTEYAVLLGVVIVALAAALFALQGPISSFIGKVADELAALLP